jgi:Spy/CpxP family protein refolding chaperone
MKSRLILAAAVLAGTTAAALAQPFGGPHHPGGFGGPMLEGVTLTDAQKAKVGEIMKAEHAQTAPQRQQLRALHEQIESTLLGSGSVTAAQLAPLQQQEATLMQQLGAAHLSTELAIRDVLTSDQLAQAAQTHAKLASLHSQERALRHGGSGDEAPPAP